MSSKTPQAAKRNKHALSLDSGLVPAKRCIQRTVSMSGFNKHFPDFDFPMPIVIKTEKDLDTVEMEQSVEQQDKREMEETASNPTKKKKKRVADSTKKMKRVADLTKKTKSVADPTKKKKKSYNQFSDKVNRWYSKKYSKKKFSKLRIVAQQLAPEIVLDAIKGYEENIVTESVPITPTTVFPVSLWSNKDLTAICEAMSATEIVSPDLFPDEPMMTPTEIVSTDFFPDEPMMTATEIVSLDMFTENFMMTPPEMVYSDLLSEDPMATANEIVSSDFFTENPIMTPTVIVSADLFPENPEHDPK